MSKRKRAARKASRAVSGCLAVIVIIVIAALFNNSPKKSTSTSTSAPPTPVTEVIAQRISATEGPTATYTDAKFVSYSEPRQLFVGDTAIDAMECPQVKCAVLAQLRPNTFVFADGETTGQFTNGSDKWYRVAHDGLSLYVPAGLLSDNQNQITVADRPTVTITDTPASGEAGATDASFFRYAVVRTMYVSKSNSVNARSCPRTTCSIVTRLSGFSAVPVEGEITGELVSNNTLWYQIISSGQTAYVHSSLLSTEKPATPLPRPTQPPAQVVATLPPVQVMSTAPPSSGFTCPRTCATAVAMGLSAEQAATCPGLDRNHNGVACYGS